MNSILHRRPHSWWRKFVPKKLIPFSLDLDLVRVHLPSIYFIDTTNFAAPRSADLPNSSFCPRPEGSLLTPPAEVDLPLAWNKRNDFGFSWHGCTFSSIGGEAVNF
jgi:hypothetical protein